MTLTEKAARALKSTDKAVFDGKVTGLMLIPSTKGSKWMLRFMSPTKKTRRDMGLGTFPDVPIAKAREMGQEQRKLISQGIDPIDYKQQREAASKVTATIPSFEQAARLVHAGRMAAWRNAKHAAQWINTLATYIFPAIGDKALPDITPQTAPKHCADLAC